jgi:hypothetical protein
VSLDTFYVGRLKGVGAASQLTAVDLATRTAVVQLVVGDKTAAVTAGFLDHLKRSLRKLGITMTGILSGNVPEFTGKDFSTKVTEMGLIHHRIPPRSPNHNAVCERFHGTVLSECFRPHSHRGRVDDIALLDRSLQAWIVDQFERFSGQATVGLAGLAGHRNPLGKDSKRLMAACQRAIPTRGDRGWPASLGRRSEDPRGRRTRVLVRRPFAR